MTAVAQLGAYVALGLDAGSAVDYSADVAEFIITETRAQTIKPGSFGSPNIEAKASAGGASVTVTFNGNPHGSSGLWFLVRSAKQTVSAELYFEYRPANAAVSSSNPKTTGYIVVTELDTGGPMGQVRRQTKTFPARGISDPITS